MCRAHPDLTAGDGKRVDVRAACDTLAGWDGRATLDGQGASLRREFCFRLRAFLNPGVPFSVLAVPFDSAHPLTTPRGIEYNDPAVQRAFADAVRFFQAGRIPLTVARAGARRWAGITLPGCPEEKGCFNSAHARPARHRRPLPSPRLQLHRWPSS